MTLDLNTAIIIAIVERGKADQLVEAAKQAGATGATVFFARGTGTHEHLSLLRIKVDAMKEVVLILAKEMQVQPVFDAVVKAGRMNDPGTGIVFTLPVGMIAGLDIH